MTLTEEELQTLLKFDSLENAEQTIRDIHTRYVQFQARSDREGMEQCRELLLKGKERALMISKNKKVNARKREEKTEIAQWFTVWLQTPDIFWDWLALRKASPDFRTRFSPGSKERPGAATQ